jgi:hypothetical protein
MKKTLFFANKYIVKDKIKSFAREFNPNYNQGFLKIVIEFSDGSTEEECFEDKNFKELREKFLNKSLRYYEANPADFAWFSFGIQKFDVERDDSTIRSAIKAIEEEYSLLESKLLGKAENRMLHILKEYEGDE